MKILIYRYPRGFWSICE